jgi:hypothetical protein
MIIADDPYGKATVWQIKDAKTGLINVKGGTPQDPFSFIALFHIDQVITFRDVQNSGKLHGQNYN